MPRLSRWLIRAALIYLLIGFLLGGLLLSAKAGVVDSRIWIWLLPHADILVAGWLLQLAMGMAFWILPRIREAGRGRVVLAWTAFTLLNVGLVAGAGLALLQYWFPWLTISAQVFSIGVLLQGLALIVFAVYAWQRVLPVITATSHQ